MVPTYQNHQLTFTKKLKKEKIFIAKKLIKPLIPMIDKSVKPQCENKVFSSDTRKEAPATYLETTSTNRSLRENKENSNSNEPGFFQKLTYFVNKIKGSKSQ